MKTSSATLFPHSCLPETEIKQILSFLGPLTICEPWHLERPGFLSEMEDHKAVKILRPPENMNPGEGFLTLLREYREWSKNHQDKGHRDFLKAVQGQESSEESSWSIRQSLLEGRQEAPAQEQDQSLKRHLLLHLARDIDDSRQEADSLLESLKQIGSPLAGSVEEEPQNPFADLPHFQGEPMIGADAMDQVLEAWIALFEKYLKNEEPLVTGNRQVLEYVLEKWEEAGEDSNEPAPGAIPFPWPDLSHHGLDDLLRVREDLLGNNAAAQIMDEIRHPGKDPKEHLARLDTLSQEVDRAFEWNGSWGRLMITVTYLAPLSGRDNGDEVLRHLSGKTLILVEEG
ncbi:MAG: hypothetical protein JRG79_06965 [Deltaproteobacteria bacterium]|nr:hypothetical protein [Deltaproteobacteria bacterium]